MQVSYTSVCLVSDNNRKIRVDADLVSKDEQAQIDACKGLDAAILNFVGCTIQECLVQVACITEDAQEAEFMDITNPRVKKMFGLCSI